MGFLSATSSHSEANGPWGGRLQHTDLDHLLWLWSSEHHPTLRRRGTRRGEDGLTDGAGFLLPLPDDDHMVRSDAREEEASKGKGRQFTFCRDRAICCCFLLVRRGSHSVAQSRWSDLLVEHGECMTPGCPPKPLCRCPSGTAEGRYSGLGLDHSTTSRPLVLLSRLISTTRLPPQWMVPTSQEPASLLSHWVRAGTKV